MQYSFRYSQNITWSVYSYLCLDSSQCFPKPSTLGLQWEGCAFMASKLAVPASLHRGQSHDKSFDKALQKRTFEAPDLRCL